MRVLVRVRHGARHSRAYDPVLRDVRVAPVWRTDWEYFERVCGGEVVREYAGWLFRG